MSLRMRMLALRDHCTRHTAVWRHAWAHRAAMEPVPRLPHEVQFLPAALALQESPVSPAPRVTMWLLIAFAAFTLLWAFFGRIDVVATAQGRIVPNNRTKTIQPFETASIQAIRVTDGQRVRAGDVLIELDATTTAADSERLAGELAAAHLQVARGRAMLVSLDTAREPGMEAPMGVDALRLQQARQQLAGQWLEYTARLNRVLADTERRQAELRSTQELVRKLEQTLPIAQQRAQDYKNLVEQAYVSRHGYLEREQERIEQEADLATQRSRLHEVQAQLREVQGQRMALQAETRRLNLDSIQEGQQRADGLQQEWNKARSRGQLMQLTSPVDGTVQQLAVHTEGGVVTPAQALMVIVPSDAPLEVEAFFENKDIGFVRPEQVATVKIETFQYTKYGTIDAVVASVSHDAIQDEKRGLIYSSRVRLHKTSLMVEGTEVALSPGMATTVEVKTGRRRVIEYFLAPLMQHTSESLRER
jgi:hemolysin D